MNRLGHLTSRPVPYDFEATFTTIRVCLITVDRCVKTFSVQDWFLGLL
jgi:hypothetical protein